METPDYDPMKAPLMNDAIPGTLPRSFWQRFFRIKFSKYHALGIIGISAVLAVPFTAVDYNYIKQTREIHNLYTSRLKHDGDNLALRLTVNEELSVLRQQGHDPKSWAVDFHKFMGKNVYYVTPDGLERKR